MNTKENAQRLLAELGDNRKRVENLRATVVAAGERLRQAEQNLADSGAALESAVVSLEHSQKLEPILRAAAEGFPVLLDGKVDPDLQFLGSPERYTLPRRERYRRFEYLENGVVHVNLMREDSGATAEGVADCEYFVRWIDKEWQ